MLHVRNAIIPHAQMVVARNYALALSQANVYTLASLEEARAIAMQAARNLDAMVASYIRPI